MEDFRPRQFVNGATLRSFINQPVSVFVKVESVESSGTTIRGQTTDQRSISVILGEPLSSSVRDQWIEADGTAISQDTVKCERVSEAIAYCDEIYLTRILLSGRHIWTIVGGGRAL